MKKGIVFFVFLFLMFTVSAAPLTYQKDVTVNYQIVCLDTNNDYCSSSTSLLLTLTAPNGSNVYKNSSMTYNGTSFNHSLDTSALGIYNMLIVSPGSNTTSEINYEVTVTGTGLSTSQGIIYLTVLFMSVLLFILILYGAIKIPFKDIRSPDGYIVQVNTYKFLKVGLWCLTYLILLWISYLAYNVTHAFLGFETAGSIFKFVFYGLMAGLFPLTVLVVWVSLITAVKNSDLRKKLERGVFTR